MRHHFRLTIGLLLAAIVLTGCGGSNDTYSPSFSGGGGTAPAFTLTVAPPSVSVTPGESAVYTATLKSVNGFATPVTLSAGGLPTGSTGTFNPPTVTPTEAGATSTLTVTTSAGIADRFRAEQAISTPPGTYTLTTTASGGGVTRTATSDLIVRSPNAPSFTITASGPVTVTQGGLARYDITLASTNGFAGTVALSQPGTPAGLTPGFTPVSVPVTANGTATSVLNIQTTATTATGTYMPIVRGASGALSNQTAVTLIVSGAGGGGTVTGLTAPTDLAVSPAGNSLYVSNAGGLAFGSEGFTAQFHINGDGSLTRLTPFTLPSGGYSSALITAPAKPNVYVASARDNLAYQFRIGTGGVLSALSPASTTTGNSFGAGTTPNDIAIDPSGRFVYTANGSNAISEMRVNADNTLSLINLLWVPAPAHTNSVSVHPNGQFVYAVGSQADAGQAIFAWRINTDGTLTEIGRTGSGVLLKVLVDRSGQYLYATDTPFDGNGGQILQFRINANGTLTALTPATISCPNAYAMAQHPTGPYLYVTNGGNVSAGTQTVSQFRINANGTLTPLTPATVPAGAAPDAIAITPNGQTAYVANFRGDSINLYHVSANGTLVPF